MLKSCFVKVKCFICDREISKPNYNRHVLSHKEDFMRVPKQKVKHEGLNCLYCGKECKNKNSLAQHECRCKNNPNHYAITLKNEKPWNKGLTKEIDERVLKNGESVKIAIRKKGSWWLGKHHSEETKRKLSLMHLGNTNGNRSKKGYYKGIWCGSSYELAYLIYCLDNNINIKRCEEYFEYQYKGSKHIYFPDFVVNGVIVEIKGYYTKLVDIKASAVNKPYKIMYKKDLKGIIDYVEDKYGKDFIKLYD